MKIVTNDISTKKDQRKWSCRSSIDQRCLVVPLSRRQWRIVVERSNTGGNKIFRTSMMVVVLSMTEITRMMKRIGTTHAVVPIIPSMLISEGFPAGLVSRILNETKSDESFLGAKIRRSFIEYANETTISTSDYSRTNLLEIHDNNEHSFVSALTSSGRRSITQQRACRPARKTSVNISYSHLVKWSRVFLSWACGPWNILQALRMSHSTGWLIGRCC
jgi:hypothetical protein